jgi:hypothetical protein
LAKGWLNCTTWHSGSSGRNGSPKRAAMAGSLVRKRRRCSPAEGVFTWLSSTHDLSALPLQYGFTCQLMNRPFDAASRKPAKTSAGTCGQSFRREPLRCCWPAGPFGSRYAAIGSGSVSACRPALVGLGVWSFLTASAHGAGLMLIPVVMPICLAAATGPTLSASSSIPVALAAIAVHGAAILATIPIVSVVVYDRVGVGFLRRGWINLDRLWIGALLVTSVIVFEPWRLTV